MRAGERGNEERQRQRERRGVETGIDSGEISVAPPVGVEIVVRGAGSKSCEERSK
jgi:hypothetical protein